MISLSVSRKSILLHLSNILYHPEMAALLREENITLRENVEASEKGFMLYRAQMENKIADKEKTYAASEDALLDKIKAIIVADLVFVPLNSLRRKSYHFF